MNLRESFPTMAILQGASTVDVASLVLQAAREIEESRMASVRFDPMVAFQVPSFDLSALFSHATEYDTDDTIVGPVPYRRALGQAVIGEAIAYLTSQGFFSMSGDSPTRVTYRVTKLGQTIKTRTDFSSYAKGSLVPTDLLHPTLATARSLFLSGHYDEAVLFAFKQVEIAVRNLGPYDPSDIGVSLMRKALGNSGPLSGTFVVDAEREAFAHLFTGAIGYLKNPQSHRTVGIDDARSSALRILLASELLQLLEQHEVTAISNQLKGPAADTQRRANTE